MHKELLKTLRKLQEEFHCFDESELDALDRGSDIWTRLHDEDTKLDSLNFKLDIYVSKKFDYSLTYNGFGDLSVEDIDNLIEQLKRKKKIMQELERFKGVSLEEK